MLAWTGSQRTPYHRFNVEKGMEKVPLNEWETSKKRKLTEYDPPREVKMGTIEYIQNVTNTYLGGTERMMGDDGPVTNVRENLQRCAQLLVRYRRAREFRP